MPRSLTEAQRRAILADLTHPILGVGPDHEIADDHGVTPEAVRRLRAQVRRDEGVAAILRLGAELAALDGWSLSPGEMVEWVMHDVVARARRHQEAARVQTDGGYRRSADGAVSRSRAPAEASGGISGGKGLEMAASVRSREVRGHAPRSPEWASASRLKAAG